MKTILAKRALRGQRANSGIEIELKFGIATCALLGALFVPNVAHADDLKKLVTDAIVNGQSTGYMDDAFSRLLASQTKSKSPVQFMAKRTRKLSDKCAELEILINQPNVPMKGGELGTTLLGFKLPICLDGTYPEMLKSLDDERKKQEMAQCHQSIKKGSIKDGFMNASTEFSSCPKGGVVGIFYDGTCKDLNPGPNAIVKEFDFDKDGSLSIQMKMPKSCLSAKANTWQLYIFEKSTPEAKKVLVGHRPISW